MANTNDQVLNSILADEASQSAEPSGTQEPTSAGTATQDNLVTLPDGRKVTGEQAAEEYRKLQQDYTQKSQRLSELEKQSTPVAPAGIDPTAKEQILKQLKGEFGMVTQEDLEAERNKIRRELQNEQQANDLERSIDGSDGRPAFKRQEVLNWMQQNPLATADISVAYKLMNEDAIAKWRITEYTKAKSGTQMPGSRGILSSVPTTPEKPAGQKATPGTRQYKEQKAQEIIDMLTKKEA